MVMCKLIILFISSIVLIMIQTIKGSKFNEVIDDLPMQSNFATYLSALEKMIWFANKQRLYVDLCLNFGLLLINTNLKSTYQMRRSSLPVNKRVRLERLITINDDIKTDFIKTVLSNFPHIDNLDTYSAMVNLFTNETSWPHHLKQFNINILNRTRFNKVRELEEIYYKWPNYRKRVYSIDTSTPTSAELNKCLVLLAQNPLNEKMQLEHCQVTYRCSRLILHGSDYGYGQANRILFLILSRFSRGCFLVSEATDKQLLDTWCVRVYNEAEFIAHHDFELLDLFMEQVSLCSLIGHAQFIRRSWIDKCIEYQTALGCFNFTTPDTSFPVKKSTRPLPWQFVRTGQMMSGNKCNAHATAVAGAMLAAAIRYIIEYYY